MARQRDGEASARVSVLLHPLTVGSAPLRLRATGAEDGIVGPACCFCEINISRLRLPCLLVLIHLALFLFSLEHSGLILASIFRSDWHAILVVPLLRGSPSGFLGFQNVLLFCSDWLWPKGIL